MERPTCSFCCYFIPFPNPDRGQCFGHEVRGKSSCRQFRPSKNTDSRRNTPQPLPVPGKGF